MKICRDRPGPGSWWRAWRGQSFSTCSRMIRYLVGARWQKRLWMEAGTWSDTVQEAMARIVKEKLEEYGNGNPKTVKELHARAYGPLRIWNELLDPDGRSVPLGVYGEAGAFGARLSVSRLYDRGESTYLMREIEILKIKRELPGKGKGRH